MSVVTKLAVKSLRHRKLSVTLSLVSIALGVVLLLGVERIRFQIKESFSNTISGTDPLGMELEELGGPMVELMPKSTRSMAAFMPGLKDRHNVLAVIRKLNDFNTEPLTAIMPAVTLIVLWSIVNPVVKALLIISIMVLLVTFAGILTTLMTSLQEHRREMAVLRSVRANVKQVFRLILLETVGISGLGILVGCVLLFFLLIILKPYIALHFGILFTIDRLRPHEILLLTLIWIVGALTGLWPAYLSYKTSLADGLIIKI